MSRVSGISQFALNAVRVSRNDVSSACSPAPTMYCELPDGLVKVCTVLAGTAPLGDAPVRESIASVRSRNFSSRISLRARAFKLVSCTRPSDSL